MTQLHAQPYDLTATGFYFETAEEFDRKAKTNRNDFGQVVEEYEIQFIDGEALDCALAQAVGLTQCNIGQFFDVVDRWGDDDKLRFILAVGECGYDFDLSRDDPNELDVDIYHLCSMRELAVQFVDEGIMGDMPESMMLYFDYEALGRDLSHDYSLTTIAGETLIYRCG